MQNPSKTQSPQWTIRKVLSWTTSYFGDHSIDTPRLDAEILLGHVLGLRRTELYIRHDMPLCPNELSAFKALIRRRVRREPVAYIVGKKGFWSLDLLVTKDVLIPRPETECLVEAALSLLPHWEGKGPAPTRVLEIGTGSGAIVLALACERPGHLFFASDRSPEAIQVARENARQCHPDTSVCFFSGDWFGPLDRETARFDMILSNPPYIRTGDIPQLQPEIVGYEPVMALDGGKDGLDAYRTIICSAHEYLVEGGYLLLETGHDQKNDIREIINACGCYEDVVFTKDYGGHDRGVRMRKTCLR